MAFILPTSESANGRIGHHNLFLLSGATVTASSDTIGYEKENAIDWKLYDWWLPSAAGSNWLRASFASPQVADYMAIAKHNLQDVSGSIKPQYSTDGGTTWNDATTATSSSDGSVIFITFDSVSAADWRLLVVTTGNAAYIGMASIGQVTILERGMGVGFAPPTLARKHKYNTSVSENGVFLGKSLRQISYSTAIDLKKITPAWVRSTWKEILAHVEIYPFFFSWDIENHSDEAVFAWVNGEIPNPTYSDTIYMQLSLPVECSL